MPRDEIVSSLEDYAGSFGAPGGFRPDYRSWLPWLNAFDEFGFPFQREGVSSVVPGLFFVGDHFLRKRKSALLIGVGEDAAIVSGHIGAFLECRRRQG